MRRKMGIIGAGVVFIGALAAYAWLSRPPGPTSEPASAPQGSDREAKRDTAGAPARAPSPEPKQEGKAPRPSGQPAVATQRDEPAWKAFQERFGVELAPEFAADGRLIGIQSAAGKGLPASPDYKSDDPQKAIARAREILDRARGLLGIRSDSPLENPIARVSATSAQVDFQQTVRGVPVAPHGSVTVDLGPQGELIRLDSAYVPGVRIMGGATLSAEQLQGKALAASVSASPVTGEGAPRVSGGSQLIWLAGAAPGAEGRHAYQYWIQGRQVVVDAATGDILLNRDRRKF